MLLLKKFLTTEKILLASVNIKILFNLVLNWMTKIVVLLYQTHLGICILSSRSGKGEPESKIKAQKLWQILWKYNLMYSIMNPSFTGTRVFMGSHIFSEYIVRKRWNT